MNKKEIIMLVQYLYNMEQRLDNAVSDCSYRFIRRDLDSIDLLEEIIAKENLKLFRGIATDILRILSIEADDIDKD